MYFYTIPSCIETEKAINLHWKFFILGASIITGIKVKQCKFYDTEFALQLFCIRM